MARRRSDLRERILDTALVLFNEEGYDKTSLREIAERLDVTKAALYYHFRSKADILLALHLRLHDLGADLLTELDGLTDGQAVVAAWPTLVDRFIGDVLANRELFLVHQRNERAFREIAETDEHRAANEDIEQRFRRLLANPSLPLELRVRMTCSLGAVMVSLMGAESIFEGESIDAVAVAVRAAVRDLFP